MTTLTRALACQIAVVALAIHGTGAEAAPVGAAAPAKKDEDIFAKCGRRTADGFVIPATKVQALADNLTDEEFAKADPECKGKRDNPEGLAKSRRKKELEAQRVAQDIRNEAAARSRAPGAVQPISVEAARAVFGPAKEIELPFLFRDAYSNYSLLNAPPAKERATGTQVSYTRDFLTNNDIISAKGAIIAWKTFPIGTDNSLSQWGVTRALFAPGVEFDQVRNHVDPKKNVDYMSFKLTTELEREAGEQSLAPLQFFRVSGYWKTDSRGDSRIVGGSAEWEPINLNAAIGVARRLLDTPVQFRWSPILHVEAEKVLNAGTLTSVTTGDVYARVGPILSADIFFAQGPLENLVFNFQYRYLWNLADSGSAKDIHYFQASAAYNLDSTGNIALSATYRDGVTPGNSTQVKDFKTGLTVKY